MSLGPGLGFRVFLRSLDSFRKTTPSFPIKLCVQDPEPYATARFAVH